MVKWLDEIRERLGRVHAEWRDYNKCVICKEIGYAPKVRCFYYAGEDKQAAIRLLAALDAVMKEVRLEEARQKHWADLNAAAAKGLIVNYVFNDPHKSLTERVRQVIADAGGEK